MNVRTMIMIAVMMAMAGSVFCYIPDDLDFNDFTEEPKASDTHQTAPSGNKIIIKSINYEMVYIPPGTFQMGSPSNEPDRDDDERQHRVKLTKGYYMGVTEVTLGQWRTFVNKTGYKSEAEKDGWAYAWDGDSWEKKRGASWKEPGFSQTDDNPVTCVSYNDAQEFIKWLNRREGSSKYRLPSEAEWEYACRAGTDTPFNTGRCLSTDQANFDGSNYPLTGCSKGVYRVKTLPVQSFVPNAWGLYDMHGNVWEWCADWYGDYPTGTVTDSTGPSSGSNRVTRGGSWYDFARGCRSANRDRDNPVNRGNSLGFRLARIP